MPRRYSHSRLQTYQSCPKKFQHEYVRKMRARKRPTYFIIGSAIHAWKEVWYETRGTDAEMARLAALKEFQNTDTSTLTSDEIHRLECDNAMVQGIVEAYPLAYPDEFKTYTNFMLEKSAELKFTDGIYWGMIDCLVQDVSGEWWLMETKTATRPSADYFAKVSIDNQVCGYMWLAREVLGSFPSGVIYDVIQKPSIRLKSKESYTQFQQRTYKEYVENWRTKDYFHRHQIRMDGKVLKRWKKNTDELISMIERHYQDEKPIFPMNTGNCISPFGSCAMMDACITGRYKEILYEQKD